LPELHTWKDIGDLLSRCSFITLVRPGVDKDTLKARALNLPGQFIEDLQSRVTMGHYIGISSTEVRMRVAQDKPISYLVPASVERYIEEYGLYKE